MCGRIGVVVTRAELLSAYPWLKEAPPPVPRYNIAPSEDVLVVGRRASFMRWGLDGRSGGVFNLRAEGLARRPTWTEALQERRVIVPVSHFFEWSAGRPFAFSAEGGGHLALAGVAGWHGGRPAFTVLTVAANDDVRPFHHRMPLVLDAGLAQNWALDRLGPKALAAALRPPPPGRLVGRPASPLVNRAGEDGPQVLDPAQLPSVHQLQLPVEAVPRDE